MDCPKCGKELEFGRGGSEPQYYWVGCDPCGVYISAREEAELMKKIDNWRVGLEQLKEYKA